MPPRTPGYKFNSLTTKFTAWKPIARDYTGLVHPTTVSGHEWPFTHYARNGKTLCGTYDVAICNTATEEATKTNFLPVAEVPIGKTLCRRCQQELR